MAAPPLVVVVEVMAGNWKDGTRASFGRWIRRIMKHPREMKRRRKKDATEFAPSLSESGRDWTAKLKTLRAC